MQLTYTPIDRVTGEPYEGADIYLTIEHPATGKFLTEAGLWVDETSQVYPTRTNGKWVYDFTQGVVGQAYMAVFYQEEYLAHSSSYTFVFNDDEEPPADNDPDSSLATFDPSLPTLKDHARLALGDKHDMSIAANVSEAMLQDATIEAKIEMFGYSEALAQLAEALIAQFGQMPSMYSEDSGLKYQWTERISAWQRIVDAARSGDIMLPGSRKTKCKCAVSTLTAQDTLSDPKSTQFRSY